MLADVREKRDEKKKVLEEQLQIIQGEKQKVDQDVQVRPLTTIVTETNLPRILNLHHKNCSKKRKKQPFY